MFNDFIESIREAANECGISLLPEDEYAFARIEYLGKTMERTREMSFAHVCEGYGPIKNVLIQSTSEMARRQYMLLRAIEWLDNALPGTQLCIYIYSDLVSRSPNRYAHNLLHCYHIFIDEVASEIVPSLFERAGYGILLAEGKSHVVDSLVSLASDSSVLSLIDLVRNEQEPGSIFFGIEPRIHICPESEADYVVQIDLEDGYLVYRLYKKEA